MESVKCVIKNEKWGQCLKGFNLSTGRISCATWIRYSRTPFGADMKAPGRDQYATSPLISRGPHGGEESVWLHHPYLGSHGGEESIWLHHLCLLGVPMLGRTQYGYITLPSQGPHGGEESIWLHQPCLLGVPMVGRNQYGCITPAFLGSPWWGGINMATSPLPSRGPHGGEKSIWLHNPHSRGPHGGEESIWLHHPYLLGVPMLGRNQYGYITLASRGPHGGEESGEINMAASSWLLGVPMVGRNESGCITPALLGSPWWGETNMATKCCLLGVPVLGRNEYGYITPAFSGSPCWGGMNMAASALPSQGPHGDEELIWLHQPCLLRVLMVERNQYGYITPIVSGSPWWGGIIP